MVVYYESSISDRCLATGPHQVRANNVDNWLCGLVSKGCTILKRETLPGLDHTCGADDYFSTRIHVGRSLMQSIEPNQNRTEPNRPKAVEVLTSNPSSRSPCACIWCWSTFVNVFVRASVPNSHCWHEINKNDLSSAASHTGLQS